MGWLLLASGGTAGGGAHPAPGEGPSGGWETAVRREPEGGVVILWPGASELLLWWAGHPDRIAPLWVLVAAGVWRLFVSGVSSGTKPDTTCDAKCKERACQRVV